MEYTTIVIGRSGKIYDLGNHEFPGQNDRPAQDAFTCLKSKVASLKPRAKKTNKIINVSKSENLEMRSNC